VLDGPFFIVTAFLLALYLPASAATTPPSGWSITADTSCEQLVEHIDSADADDVTAGFLAVWGVMQKIDRERAARNLGNVMLQCHTHPSWTLRQAITAADDAQPAEQAGAAPPMPKAEEAPISVNPADIAVAPGKYVGKFIEVGKLVCYYAGTDDYRCTATTPPIMAIFAKSLTSDEGQKIITEECDTLEKAFSATNCKVFLRLRFTAEDVSDDIVSGYQRRTLITVESAEIRWPSARRR